MDITNLVRARDVGVTALYGEVLIGASGVVTSQTSLGFTVAYGGSAGNYTITLDRPYPELLYPQFITLNAARVNANIQLATRDMAARTLTIFYSIALVGTHPANGSTIYIALTLKDSTVGP